MTPAATRKAGYQKALDRMAKLLPHVVEAGRRNPDQLLRALIPLYLVGLDTELQAAFHSGEIHRFWSARGVDFAHTNISQQFRKHVGYARTLKTGLQITVNGCRYVEAATQERA